MSAYEEYGGGVHDRWYGVIDNDCTECGAKSGDKCWNAISEKSKHIPCWRRAKVSA